MNDNLVDCDVCGHLIYEDEGRNVKKDSRVLFVCIDCEETLGPVGDIQNASPKRRDQKAPEKTRTKFRSWY